MANLPFTLHKLSADFYRDYDSATYPEIENKADRPYMVMVVRMDGNTFALPFRTNIRHDFCYKFRSTGRDTQSRTGIDFSKAVVVNDLRYIGESATVDHKEYVELRNKYFFVIKKFREYLNGYVDFRRNGGNRYVAQKYRYSTLQYFEKELGLPQPE